jgi:hypothetical protein
MWSDWKVADINRLLKPHGVRLVLKKSKDWGKNVSVTAHATGVVVKRVRAPKAPAVEPGPVSPAAMAPLS